MATTAKSGISIEEVVKVSESRRGLTRDDVSELIKLARTTNGRVTGAFPLGIPAPDGTWTAPNHWGKVVVRLPHNGIDLNKLIGYAIDRGHIIIVHPIGVPQIDEIEATIQAVGQAERG